MEGDVVGDVVGAAVQTVLQSLLPVLKDEINLLRDFKSDFKKLQQSFLTIQDYLSEADMQHVTDKSVKRWLRKLESLAYEADNVLDEFNYQILRNQLNSQKKFRKKVRNFFTQSNPIALRRRLGREIRDINEKLELINKEANSFGLQLKLARVASVRLRGAHVLAIRETDSFTVDPIVVGREDDVLKIVNVLTASSTEDTFSIVPIVGMGGLGKTTLARLVFNDDRVKNHFANNLFWVYVSENFDALAIFKRILEDLIKKEVGIQSREVVLSELGQNLRDKRYLLILDDVWNEKPDEWDNFIHSLSGISSAKGNAIVVTTRKENVASIMKTPYIHKLSILSVENCWSIIREKVFNKEQEVPIEFKMMGNMIAERCQGLPLAAKVVGGLLWDKSKDDWSSIQHNWLSYFTKEGDAILQILKLSFDNLSSPLLKKCFAYCSLFKKGDDISSTRLIELWMAEGFLQIDGQGDMEATGKKFLNLLLQNSLLQVIERNTYGNITYCSMHDLVHDLAWHVLGANSNSRNEKSLDDTYQVRYIEIKSTKNDSCLLRQEQTKCLRTLFIRVQVPKKMFLDFKSLHTLILMGGDIVDLPHLVGTLLHLRFLCVTDTWIKTLPDSIGKLYHLQTLRVGYNLKRLPNTLTNLISLRHLHIPAIELPPELGQLASLRTLPYFKVGLKKGCRISELGSLKNLKGELEIHNLEMVHDKDEAQSAHLCHKVDLYKLKLAWNESQGGGTNDEDVLEGLQPQSNLKSLELCGFRGTRLSLWASKMAVRDNTKGDWIPFNNLVNIRLISCQECKEAPTLGHLPNLKFICFNDLPNVKSLGASFYGDVKCGTTIGGNKKTNILFPTLERLDLSRMPNLIEWQEIGLLPTPTETQLHEVVAFPCLEYLEIGECNKLRTSPGHFPCLKELIILTMESDCPLRNICSSIGSLTRLLIFRVDELICLPDELFFNNQNLSFLEVSDCPNMTCLVPHIVGDKTSLKELRILKCPKLENMPDHLHQLSLLETMCIGDCQKLKSLPYPSGGQSQGFTSLREFRLIKCPELTNLPLKMVESFAPTIERLELRYLSLLNSNTVFGCLKEMSRLTHLEIDDVLKFTILPEVFGSLCSLQNLSFGPFSDSSEDFLSFNEDLESILRGASQHIRDITLRGNVHWNSLPNKLQDLTNLTGLRLYNFGVESVPEWLGNSSSLEELFLWDCVKLRNLPSKEAMQRLTKLRTLVILQCPLLVERLRTEEEEGRSFSNDSEWPNIRHIPNVTY